jgi:hypothetical protein
MSITTTGQARGKIEALLLTRKEVLCGGGAKDYAHYKQIVGEITGLNLAIGELNDLQKRIDTNNGDIDD